MLCRKSSWDELKIGASQFALSFLLIEVRNSVERCGLLGLQKQLLSGIWTKKVVSDLHEGATIIRRLLGNQEWFGSGSRVLITTRNEHLLIEHEIERRLKVEELNDDDSHQLFSWKAFKRGYPEEDFFGLSESVISYAKGLPLALEVLVSSLYGRGLSEWSCTLRKLGRVCKSDISDVFKISYNDLDSEEKQLFLDIACFFNGQDKDRVTEMLTICDVSATIGIKVLMERSLLTLSNRGLWMHDLLGEMGHKIVHLESPNEPGRRGRLRLPEEVKHVLTRNTGTEVIEGIFVQSTESGAEVDATSKSFSMMHKLRYLKIKNVNLPKGLEYLPNSLRILDWTSTPNFKGMPYLELLFLEGCTGLHEVDPGIEELERLTVLNLKECKNLVHFANSVRGLKSLKCLDLSSCSKLKKLPNDMGNLESLEELHVNGTGLSKLPSSIGMLERLHVLKMEDCKDLMSLPISVRGLKSLVIVNISGCSKLDKFPEDMGNMECLVEVDACGTSIRELPCSIGMLEGLVSMSLRDCKNLVCLLSSVGGLKSLKDLDLTGCLKLDKLPDELVMLHVWRSLM
ncbi:hypothetical protein ACLB2K_017108 [Fragaria x ananassa]